jgi:hypothetical protein
MRKLKYGLLFGLAAIVCCLGLVWVQSSRPVAASARTYDFGSRRAGSEVHHVFQIANASWRSVGVTNVTTSCGCTLVDRPPKVLLRRSSTSIPVVFRTPDTDGPVSTRVTLTLENGQSIELSVQGQVIRRAPNKLDLGEVRRGDSATASFSVRPDGQFTKLVGLDYDDSLFSAVVQPDGGDWRITVRPSDHVSFGPLAGKLTIKTDDPTDPNTQVELAGYVLAPFEAKPRRLLAGIVGDENVDMPLEVYSPYGHALKVVSIELSDPRLLEVVGEPTPASGGTLRVSIRLHAGRLTVAQKAEVRVNLTGQGGKAFVLHVPVYALRKQIEERERP